jgi:fructose-1,6-bisphosphatase II
MLPGGDADLLLGVGGTPKGVMAACAARTRGAGIWGRLAPQSAAEHAAVMSAGRPTEQGLELDAAVRLIRHSPSTEE